MRRVLLALVLATSMVVLVAPAGSAAAVCTGGTYNYRQTSSGACAWGNVRVRKVSYMRVDVVVVDTVADGKCARVEVQEARSLMPDATVYTATACGKGTSKPLQFTFPYSGRVPGLTQGWRIRVCAKTCSSRKAYRAEINAG